MLKYYLIVLLEQVKQTIITSSKKLEKKKYPKKNKERKNETKRD